MIRYVILFGWAFVGMNAAWAEDAGRIASMDEMTFRSPKEKGRAELVAGKVGLAIRFQFDKDARGAFFTSNLRGTPEWDRAGGFSFWVKGDGKDGFGGLEFLHDEDFAVRYDFAFRVKADEWTKVNVAWSDLIPVLPGPKAKPIGGPGGNAPSKLTGPWFGKGWYWGDYPALSFAVDEIRLEPNLGRGAEDYRPAGPPLRRTLARLEAGLPMTIVTMGDSLTDTRHWANREVAWPSLLKDRLGKIHGSEVAIINPAIGGSQLRQNLILMPIWLAKAPEPDLVTVFFGGNDREAGMRGEEFERACADAVDRIRRATRGKADVLILTTNPTAVHWEDTSELAEACRKAARDRNAGLADTAGAFREAGRENKERLFVHDRVHLSRVGHEVVAGAVEEALRKYGR